MKIKYCFIQDFIDGQAPYLYKHIFSQSELSELLHGSIKSDTESFVSVIVASVWQLFHYLTLNQVGPKSEPQTETEETI